MAIDDGSPLAEVDLANGPVDVAVTASGWSTNACPL